MHCLTHHPTGLNGAVLFILPILSHVWCNGRRDFPTPLVLSKIFNKFAIGANQVHDNCVINLWVENANAAVRCQLHWMSIFTHLNWHVVLQYQVSAGIADERIIHSLCSHYLHLLVLDCSILDRLEKLSQFVQLFLLDQWALEKILQTSKLKLLVLISKPCISSAPDNGCQATDLILSKKNCALTLFIVYTVKNTKVILCLHKIFFSENNTVVQSRNYGEFQLYLSHKLT